jgi:hypothetical protein
MAKLNLEEGKRRYARFCESNNSEQKKYKLFIVTKRNTDTNEETKTVYYDEITEPGQGNIDVKLSETTFTGTLTDLDREIQRIKQ